MFVPPMGSQMHFCFQKLSLEKKTDPNPLMLNCLHLSTCVCVCVSSLRGGHANLLCVSFQFERMIPEGNTIQTLQRCKGTLNWEEA